MTAAAAQSFDEPYEEPKPRRAKASGAEIRAKIAANRSKRLAIAEAMKREAGVTKHDVHEEDFGGLAYIDRGTIWSPEGRKIIQLYTVAHECGHIFLHNTGTLGYLLPGHIKELEAESYAHQAFREHGMELPKHLSDWGRSYVGSWVEKDRAAGIPIDPRAEAFAKGTRSPYEPLRYVPRTWKLHRALPPARIEINPAAADPAPSKITWRDDARQLLSFVWHSFLFSFMLAHVELWVLVDKGLYVMRDRSVIDRHTFLLLMIATLIQTSMAVMARSMWRK